MRCIARSPGRACVYLLVGTVTIGGALFSVIEPDADWFDGVWWTIVTLTTVGYGDYSPESFLGRWLAAFVMAGGIGAVAILTGILADEIREARIHDKRRDARARRRHRARDVDHGSRDSEKLQREGLAPRGRRRAAQGPPTTPRRRRCEPTPSPPFPRRRPRGGPRARHRVHRLRRGRRHRVLRGPERPIVENRYCDDEAVRGNRRRSRRPAVLLVLRRRRRRRQPLAPGTRAQRRRHASRRPTSPRTPAAAASARARGSKRQRRRPRRARTSSGGG